MALLWFQMVKWSLQEAPVASSMRLSCRWPHSNCRSLSTANRSRLPFPLVTLWRASCSGVGWVKLKEGVQGKCQLKVNTPINKINNENN